MCRVLAYSGRPVAVDDLLFEPDSSLVRQAYDPQQLHMLNLGGFGMLAWDRDSRDPERPFSYRSTDLPVFDRNLRALSGKVRASCLLAHVRGIAYRSDANFGPSNLHPFQFPGCAWSMAHNGDLAGYSVMRQDLVARLDPAISARIEGTTDSEGIYALVMSELEDAERDAAPEQLAAALVRALQIIRELRDRHGLHRSSSCNLFFSNGRGIVALRYTFDFGCYDVDAPEKIHETNTRYLSLWYTAGDHYGLVDGEWRMTGEASRADSVLIASEPLTRDTSGWVEVPEYTLLSVDPSADGVCIRTLDVDV